MGGALTRMLGRSGGGGGAGAFGNHAYWRVFCTDNYGDSSFILIAEVQFLDASGTVLTATGGTAIGSTQATGNEYTKAFDGVTGTSAGWASSSGNVTNQWVGYHFASAQPVEKVRISMATNSLTMIPKNCKLEYSDDGSSWTTAFSFLNLNLLGGQITYPETIASGYHHFWRLFCTDNNGGSTYIMIDEVEFRATSGGADQVPAMASNNGGTTGRVVGSGQLGAGNEMYRAFDNTVAPFNSWASPGTTNQYVGALLATPIAVQEIMVRAGSDTSNAPKNMRLDYSDDGTTWTTQKTFTAQTGWTSGQTRVLTAI